MPVKYKVVSKRPGGVAGENDVSYYPTVTGRTVVGLREISDIVSDSTSFTSADIYGMAEGLLQVIPKLLQNGHSVKLGELGIFSLSVRAEGSSDPVDVSVHNIKEVRLNFLPAKQLKRDMQLTKFKKVK